MIMTEDLQCYRVGGSVRDELMGLAAGDRDWVVVGATPGQMIAHGFRPVGKDFPVFLHPDTHEEYALARTERKTAPGYKGFAVHFAPDVTLEDDLLRRDLTINAMAVPATDRPPHFAACPPTGEAGEPTGDACDTPGSLPGLIDPFNGLKDLRDRIFRHVSPAFREDPVRILRVARFAARFPDFRVADETLALMREMSTAGEVDALVPERVWQELSRGLMSQRPSRMIEVLEDTGALAILLPGLPPVSERPAWLAAIDRSAAAGDPLPVRFAVMMAAVDTRRAAGLCPDEAAAAAGPADAARPGAPDGPACPGGPARSAAAVDTDSRTRDGRSSLPHDRHTTRIEQLARQLRASNECIDAARRLASELGSAMPTAAAQRWLHDLERHDAHALLALFNRHDLWRRPEQLDTLLQGAMRLVDGSSPAPSLQAAAQAARAIDTGRVAREHASNPQAIRAAIDAARTEAIALALKG